MNSASSAGVMVISASVSRIGAGSAESERRLEDAGEGDIGTDDTEDGDWGVGSDA